MWSVDSGDVSWIVLERGSNFVPEFFVRRIHNIMFEHYVVDPMLWINPSSRSRDIPCNVPTIILILVSTSRDLTVWCVVSQDQVSTNLLTLRSLFETSRLRLMSTSLDWNVKVASFRSVMPSISSPGDHSWPGWCPRWTRWYPRDLHLQNTLGLGVDVLV